jgi:hypothetical protein
VCRGARPKAQEALAQQEQQQGNPRSVSCSSPLSYRVLETCYFNWLSCVSRLLTVVRSSYQGLRRRRGGRRRRTTGFRSDLVSYCNRLTDAGRLPSFSSNTPVRKVGELPCCYCV